MGQLPINLLMSPSLAYDTRSFPIGLRMGLIIDAMSEGVRKGDSADESFDESCGPGQCNAEVTSAGYISSILCLAHTAKQYKFVHAFKAEGETC